MNDDQAAAVDPLEVIRRHIRAIVLALGAVDLVNPAAETITFRMRGTCDTLRVDVDELRWFLR